MTMQRATLEQGIRHVMADPATDPDLNSEPDPAAEDPQENEREVAHIAAHFDAEQVAAAQRVVAEVRAIEVQAQALDAQVLEQMAQLPVNGAANGMEQVPPGPDHAVIVQQDAQINQLVAAVQPAHQNYCVRFICVTFTVVLPGIAAGLYIYHALGGAGTRRAFAGPANDGPAPIDASAFVQNWRNVSDSDYWDNLATFVDRNHPRAFHEQLLFMQFTEDLARHRMTREFVWKQASDKLQMVLRLTDNVQSKGLASTYRLLKDLTYQGETLPRAISANLMSHALIVWWCNVVRG